MIEIDPTVLHRKNFAFKAEKVTPEGTFAGYASVFGNADSYREVVDPGAFADSIKKIKAGGDPLPVLWQHMSSQPIGGSDVLKEDDRGLYTEGFLLIDDIPQAKAAHTLMTKRIVKGLSIGYYVEDGFYNEKEGLYHLKKLDLREYSVVTFPANSEATIEEVKHITGAGRLPTLKEFEGFLREAGFTKTQATAIAGHGLRKLLDQGEPDGNTGARVLGLLENFKI